MHKMWVRIPKSGRRFKEIGVRIIFTKWLRNRWYDIGLWENKIRKNCRMRLGLFEWFRPCGQQTIPTTPCDVTAGNREFEGRKRFEKETYFLKATLSSTPGPLA